MAAKNSRENLEMIAYWHKVIISMNLPDNGPPEGPTETSALPEGEDEDEEKDNDEDDWDKEEDYRDEDRVDDQQKTDAKGRGSDSGSDRSENASRQSEHPSHQSDEDYQETNNGDEDDDESVRVTRREAQTGRAPAVKPDYEGIPARYTETADEAEDFFLSTTFRTLITSLCASVDETDHSRDVIEILEAGVRSLHNPAIVDGLKREKDELHAIGIIGYVWLRWVRRRCEGLAEYRVQTRTRAAEDSLTEVYGAAYATLIMHARKRLETKIDTLAKIIKFWSLQLYKANDDGDSWASDRLAKLPIRPLDNAAPNELARRYADMEEKHGLWDMAGMLTVRMRARPPPIYDFLARNENTMLSEKSRFDWAQRQVFTILSSMNKRLLLAILNGQLGRLRSERPSTKPLRDAVLRVHDKHEETRTRAKQLVQPAIYIMALHDARGISPTGSQWAIVWAGLHDYIGEGEKENRLARWIDVALNEDVLWNVGRAKHGFRRYFDNKEHEENPNIKSVPRRDIARAFLKGMRLRIRKAKADGRLEMPLAAPVTEVGYSANPLQRIESHQRHTSSNFLMNLLEAIFQHHFPGCFSMHGTCVFSCFRVEHCWTAEVVFTELSQAYITDGCGFSQHPAGTSNSSSFEKESIGHWKRWETTALRPAYMNKLEKLVKRRHATEKCRIKSGQRHTKKFETGRQSQPRHKDSRAGLSYQTRSFTNKNKSERD